MKMPDERMLPGDVVSRGIQEIGGGDVMDYGRYENSPLVSYGPTPEGDYHVYYRVCPKCGRFVKADKQCRIPEYQKDAPNATCKRCGRVQMEFATWDYDEMEDAYAAHTDIYG